MQIFSVCVKCNYGRREANKWFDLLAKSVRIARVTFMISESEFHVQIPCRLAEGPRYSE